MEILVSNDVAITFSPLKSKPVKSCKHLCEKLYKSNFALKMIRIAIFKLITQFKLFRRFHCRRFEKKPQPVLSSCAILKWVYLKKFSQNLKIYFVLVLKYSSSAIMMLFAIAWQEWTFVFPTQINPSKYTRTTKGFIQFALCHGSSKSSQVIVVLFLLRIE